MKKLPGTWQVHFSTGPSQRTGHAGFLTVISHGKAATRFMCGGIFNDHFIANYFPESVRVKNFENRSIFDKVMTQLGGVFMTHGIYLLKCLADLC